MNPSNENAPMTVWLESLGCAKNSVDSDEMLGRLAADGWAQAQTPEDADLIVVNTCSFIQPAVEESVETILTLAEYKRTGRCSRLVVVGCLPQRYGEDLAAELPEVDQFLGTGAFHRIAEAAAGHSPAAACILPDPGDAKDDGAPRILSDAPFAYVKIAEGCGRRCTYCIIPRLRGGLRSRSAEDVLAEARRLIDTDVREIILVAQETTAWGRDFASPGRFSDLLLRLSDLSPFTRFRFLYGHPDTLTPDIIDAVAERENLCSYFDVPIQHASPTVLRRMGRPGDPDRLNALFESIRAKMPDAALRTTLITGFPGETRKDMNLLVKFVEKVRFDHLGVFPYSDAEDVPAFGLGDKVTPRTAKRRRDRVMEIQAGISEANNAKYVGRTVRVLVEEELPDGLFAGRGPFQAPEVDGLTLVRGRDVVVGAFRDVKITAAEIYDLYGEAV